MSKLLSENEQAAIDRLADAWNIFVELEVLHPSERHEFAAAIHVAQQIVMSRPVMREQKRDHVIKIIINGVTREIIVPDDRPYVVNYEIICEMANEDPQYNPSVMYRGKNTDGILSSGQRVDIEAGMIFDVCVTGNA